MREITDHKVNGCNDAIAVHAVDGPGLGGASHCYRVTHPNHQTPGRESHHVLDFQKGLVAEVGTNGVTHEVLLAVLIDRLRGFQAGPFACRENAIALTKLEEALHWLHHRTRARILRGVESTLNK